MHLFRIIVLIATTLPVVRVAGESDSKLPALPQCALACKQQVLINYTSSCSTTDTTCLCSDTQYQTALADCAMVSCSVREALTAKFVESRQCNTPIRRRYAVADAGTIIPFVFATVLVMIRIAAKSMRLGGGWGPDDFTIVASYVRMVRYGFGMNIWDIFPLDNITKAYKYFYVFILAYKGLISLAKISVCLFLLRIFQSNIFRYTAYTMIGINSAVAISWIIVDAFHCVPVHLAWTGWQDPKQGKCIDFNAATFANGFVNIAVDTIMVIMPVYEIMKLTLSFRKKIGVAFMFAIGLVLAAIGVIRVIVFSYNSSSANPTWDMQALNHWSVIECQVAIICACLPATRVFIAHIFPGVFQFTTGHVSSYQSQPCRPRQTRHLNETSRISQKISYTVDYSDERSESRSSVQLIDVEMAKHQIN
ncbi:hypothetical protein DTO063F5_4128 [Paecilomyces variotii]|nr:hypothetical protein DTO063F5_4128 [Paecilomyces variotii]